MKFKQAFLTVVLLGLCLAPGAQAATSTYGASGAYAANDCTNQIDCTTTIGYAGSATCAPNCIAGAPTEGTLAISLTATPFHPPSPCFAKLVEGTLEVVWSDATTTTASLTGKARGNKGYALQITITGGTNPFFPSGRPSKGFVSHPPSPCSPGAFTGSLALRPAR
jgi:hypothetical protein